MTLRSDFRAAYDDIAEDYDRHWSVHVREPQQRLTRELRLARGLRCADLGCGTGVDTVDMVRAVAPGEVVAVDCSAVMLQTAQRRAHAAGSSLTTQCEEAGAFILAATPSTYDVVTLRFCLGYLDWRALVPRIPRLLRPGGRVGILTILATSAPQAYETYEGMATAFGLPNVERSAPQALQEVEAGLREGGATSTAGWTHSFRLMFATGEQLAKFLRESGIASHPLLEQLPTSAASLLWKRFAEAVEVHRTPQGIPLDFDLAGVIAGVAMH